MVPQSEIFIKGNTLEKKITWPRFGKYSQISQDIYSYRSIPGDIVCSVPEHHNKVNIIINWVNEFFGFPAHVKSYLHCMVVC